MRTTSLIVVCSLAVSEAWVAGSTGTARQQQTALNLQSREAFLKTAAAGVLSSTFLNGPLQSAKAAELVTLPNGVKYEVKKTGQGPKPDLGELVAIRFRAFCGDNKIDDIFETPEPYYTRVGSGGLVKGVEETLPLMQLGDRWELTIPVGDSWRGFGRVKKNTTVSFFIGVFLTLFHRFRATWLLGQRDDLPLQASLAFRLMRPSFST